jgi:hypothetical protein
MEARFGHDFGVVRIHADADAARSAADIHALAYTFGPHVVMGGGRYEPDSAEGQRLLAHELTHVTQQGQQASRPTSISDPHDPAELAAARVAVGSSAGAQVILRQAIRSDGRTGRAAGASAAAVKASSRGAVVEDGQRRSPGQMEKSQFLTVLRDALVDGCEAELAPFGRTARDCPYILRTIERHAGRPVSSLMRLIQAFAHPPPGADANELIESVTRNARTVARQLAEKHGDRLQAATENGRAALPRHDPGGLRAQLGGGRPLDGAVRERMQRAFGHGIASVRIHDDSSAARLSAGLGARAFTVGEHVAFAAGQYRPGTISGETLIAHELSHTIQQSNSRMRTETGGAHQDRELEREADRTASLAVAGRRVATDVESTASPQAGEDGAWVQRWPVVVAGALELGADAVIVTEVAAVTTAEVVVVDGALVAAADVAAPAVIEAVAPAVLESVVPAALESVVPAAVASSSSMSTAATVGAGLAATTLSGDSPTSEEQDRRRDCMRDNPYAIPCADELPLDEQVVEWIMRQGYGFESLGECEGYASHGPGVIGACSGAPGETWHCRVHPYVDPISRTSKPGGVVSVFSCLCCRADGTVGYEWIPDHWSPGAF